MTFADEVAAVLGVDVVDEEQLLDMISELRGFNRDPINCSKCLGPMRRHCSNQGCEEFCG